MMTMHRQHLSLTLAVRLCRVCSSKIYDFQFLWPMSDHGSSGLGSTADEGSCGWKAADFPPLNIGEVSRPPGSWLSVAKEATSGARKRPLADLTNSRSPSSSPAHKDCSATSLEEWKLSAAHDQVLVLVDLDNWPDFFQSLPCSLPFHVAAFHRTQKGLKSPAILMPQIKRSRAVRDLGNKLVFVETGPTKDSADVALIMLATRIADAANPDAQLVVISSDAAFVQLQKDLNHHRKRVALITGQRLSDLEALLRVWAIESTSYDSSNHPPVAGKFTVGAVSPQRKKRKRAKRSGSHCSREMSPSRSPSRGQMSGRRVECSLSPCNSSSFAAPSNGPAMKYPVPRPAGVVLGFRATQSQEGQPNHVCLQSPTSVFSRLQSPSQSPRR